MEFLREYVAATPWAIAGGAIVFIAGLWHPMMAVAAAGLVAAVADRK